MALVKPSVRQNVANNVEKNASCDVNSLKPPGWISHVPLRSSVWLDELPREPREEVASPFNKAFSLSTFDEHREMKAIGLGYRYAKAIPRAPPRTNSIRFLHSPHSAATITSCYSHGAG